MADAVSVGLTDVAVGSGSHVAVSQMSFEVVEDTLNTESGGVETIVTKPPESSASSQALEMKDHVSSDTCV